MDQRVTSSWWRESIENQVYQFGTSGSQREGYARSKGIYFIFALILIESLLIRHCSLKLEKLQSRSLFSCNYEKETRITRRKNRKRTNETCVGKHCFKLTNHEISDTAVGEKQKRGGFCTFLRRRSVSRKKRRRRRSTPCEAAVNTRP